MSESKPLCLGVMSSAKTPPGTGPDRPCRPACGRFQGLTTRPGEMSSPVGERRQLTSRSPTKLRHRLPICSQSRIFMKKVTQDAVITNVGREEGEKRSTTGALRFSRNNVGGEEKRQKRSPQGSLQKRGRRKRGRPQGRPRLAFDPPHSAVDPTK